MQIPRIIKIAQNWNHLTCESYVQCHQDNEALASDISSVLDKFGADSFITPEKPGDSRPPASQDPLDTEEFIPLIHYLLCLHDKTVSASASELLYSKLKENNQLLEKVQKESLDYKNEV